MFHPLLHVPPTGVIVTVALRVIASLRASTKVEKTSKLAVFTRWLRTNSPKLGSPAAISTPRIVMTIRSSGSVKPRLARMLFLSARVASARFRAGMGEREHAIGLLAAVGDGRGDDGVGGRGGRHVAVGGVLHRDGVARRHVRQ